MWPDEVLTLVVPYFFSVPTIAPVRWAALSALLPLMTVSRCAAPPPPALLPILVTWSQSDMVSDDVRGILEGYGMGVCEMSEACFSGV